MCSRRLLAAFNVRPFAPCRRLLWPLLTSARASRHLSMTVARRFPSAPVQISPGIALSPSRLCLSDLRHGVPYKFRALQISACLPRRAASYPLPVRQASALPSASSRFAVTRDTLAVRLTLPLVGRVEDFHPHVRAPCRAHRQQAANPAARGFCSATVRISARREPKRSRWQQHPYAEQLVPAYRRWSSADHPAGESPTSRP